MFDPLGEDLAAPAAPWHALATVPPGLPAAPSVTLHDVELAAVGPWAAMTGPTVLDETKFRSMIAAASDPEVDAAPVHPGHFDPRFPHLMDGEPALGWVRPTRIAGGKLLGDLVDVPAALAGAVLKAYRRRSIEFREDVVTPSGRRYAAALTGLGMLGLQAPAVKGLGDVARLYTYAAGQPSSDVVVVPIDGDTLALGAPLPALTVLAGHDGRRLAAVPEDGGPLVPLTDQRLRQLVGLAENADVSAIQAALTAAATAPPAAAAPGSLPALQQVPPSPSQPTFPGAAPAGPSPLAGQVIVSRQGATFIVGANGQLQPYADPAAAPAAPAAPAPQPQPVAGYPAAPQYAPAPAPAGYPQVPSYPGLAAVPGLPQAPAPSAAPAPTMPAPGLPVAAGAAPYGYPQAPAYPPPAYQPPAYGPAGYPQPQYAPAPAPAPAMPGVVQMSAGAVAELQTRAIRGDAAMTAIEAQQREQLLAAAVGEGRLAVHEVDAWRNGLVTNPAGTQQLLGALAPGRVPVGELGSTAALGAGSPAAAQAQDAAFTAWENETFPELAAQRAAAAGGAAAPSTPSF